MPDIQSMIGKEVDVIANGTKYTGTLIEVSDVEVHLKTVDAVGRASCIVGERGKA